MLSFIAPTVFMLSGHKSLTSIIHGHLFHLLRARPDKAVKNCGEVAIMMSALINNPARKEVHE